MPDTTARFALPLLVPGQAQKEMFHNEALALLDLAVQPSVLGVGLIEPPAVPAPGDCYVVGDAPVGAWAGQAGALAGWTGQGWRFVPPCEGMCVWDSARRLGVRRVDGAWIAGSLNAVRLSVAGLQVVGARRGAIPAPVGGSLADDEARAAIAGILAALRGHGLIAE